MFARCGCAVILALLLNPLTATAQSGDGILKKVDEVEYGAQDTIAVVKMELIDSAGGRSERKLEMYQKGSQQRLVRFLEPADVKGLAFLDEGKDKMYLYLPAFHKIRRIAGHVKNDNFAGTDFSYDDMSSDAFSDRLKVVAVREEAEFLILDLIPKPGTESEYGKLIMRVRKSDSIFDRIEFFDKSDKPWKTMTRADFRPAGKYTQSFFVEMKDMKKNHTTRNVVQSIKTDTGLKDSFFSKRQLKRN